MLDFPISHRPTQSRVSRSCSAISSSLALFAIIFSADSFIAIKRAFKEKVMLEKNRMISKIFFIALVVFFITTVSHAQGIFGNNSSSSSNVSSRGMLNQQSTSETTIPQGNTTNNTTTTTTNNTSISSNTVTSDTNIDSIPQDDGTRAWADLQIAELEAQLEEANKQ